MKAHQKYIIAKENHQDSIADFRQLKKTWHSPTRTIMEIMSKNLILKR